MSIRTSTEASLEVGEGYDLFEELIRQRVAAVEGPVFTTDAYPNDLWRVWLEAIPADRRKHYNCDCCRHFLQKYGGLVTLDDTGLVSPVLWETAFDIPEFFREAATAMRSLLVRAKVNGVFLWGEKEKVWGTPKTVGVTEWTHLSGCPSCKCWSHPLLSASQKAAELKEDYKTLSHALSDYPSEVVAQALRVLDAGAVYRSEKALGVAKWAADLHQRLNGVKGERRKNLIWLAVATAPVGFCHLRSTVISTLLDDIKAGLDFDSISRRWKDKLNPLQYQRPTAPPSSGSIAQAEKTFEATGAAKSLERRFATLSDVLSALWKPPTFTPVETTGRTAGGLFDHLRTDRKPVEAIDLPAESVTFEKFRSKVLPLAAVVEVQVPYTGPFYGLLTAVHSDAPAILQWDGLDGYERNPVSWYFYNSGSTATNWHLQSGQWAEVTALFLSPHQWQKPEQFTHQGLHSFWALKGCWDGRCGSGTGSCLFPETLKSEYNAVRSVIEAHSRTGTLQGAETGNANGIAFAKGRTESPMTVRVRTASGRAVYKIDRWD